MYQSIDTYIVARVAELNASISGTTNDLKLITTTLNTDLLPASEKDMSYIVKINNFEQQDTEAELYDVQGEIEMFFKCTNKDKAKYQTIIDSYVFALARIIWGNNSYSTSTVYFEITTVGASNLNNFDNDLLSCQITFKGFIKVE